MPCGKESCVWCETCIYDVPLDTSINKVTNCKMKDFNIIPLVGNPSTAQIVLPGINNRNCMKPLGAECVQLSLPFKENNDNSPYCNGCEHFLKLERPNKASYNTRCTAETPRAGGSYRVVELNVYENEKVKKPFWCPLIKDKIVNGLSNEKRITVGGHTVYPNKNTSALSDEQLSDWNKSKERAKLREKWLGMSGITSWADIKINERYHLPPTLKKGRMDLLVKIKYIGSIQCENIKTRESVWLYKEDEEYKFLSPLR